MDYRTWSVLFVVVIPAVTAIWTSEETKRAGFRRLHYHTKRHMLPSSTGRLEDHKPKRRHTSLKPKEIRKKPSGYLKPINEDDIGNDGIVSVAVGPPPIRLKYDKAIWRRNTTKQTNNITDYRATNLVRDVLTQLGREFLTHHVSEDFVFGQYVGIAMKNLTNDLRLKMQQEILELIVKYQKKNRGEIKPDTTTDKTEKLSDESLVKGMKVEKIERRTSINETEDNWPDFSNLAKIVG